MEPNLDNEAAMKLAKHPESDAGAEHIEIRHHFLGERVLAGDIAVTGMSTEDNVANKQPYQGSKQEIVSNSSRNSLA
jgi:hypothetical protein